MNNGNKYKGVKRELFTVQDEFKKYVTTLKYQPFVIGQKYKFKERFSYSLHRVPIGMSYNFPEFINFKKSKRLMFIGSTGSGKTFFMSGLIDRLLASGAVGFIADLKGEYTYKHLMLQPHFHQFLMKGEEPTGFNIKVYYPYFMAKITGKSRQKHEHYIQFGLKDITKFDFLTLVPHAKEQNIKPFIDNLWISVMNETITSFEEMIDYIDDSEDLHHSSKRILKYTIQSLLNTGVLGDKYERPTVVKDLNEGYTVILNLKGITRFADVDNPASAYLAIMIRDIYNSKVMGKLDRSKHHFISIDEINKFCPRSGNSSSKKEILKIYDLSRSERISLLSSTQDYTRVPQTLIYQSNYIFLAHNTSLNDSAEIIKSSLPEEYDVPQTFKAKVGSIFSGMGVHKDGSRDWLMIDKISKTYKTITPLAPLSYIMEEVD